MNWDSLMDLLFSKVAEFYSPRNMLLFGATGTGKTCLLNCMVVDFINKSKGNYALIVETACARTSFARHYKGKYIFANDDGLNGSTTHIKNNLTVFNVDRPGINVSKLIQDILDEMDAMGAEQILIILDDADTLVTAETEDSLAPLFSTAKGRNISIIAAFQCLEDMDNNYQFNRAIINTTTVFLITRICDAKSATPNNWQKKTSFPPVLQRHGKDEDSYEVAVVIADKSLKNVVKVPYSPPCSTDVPEMR